MSSATVNFDSLRVRFPQEFVFGAATSAFQVEGAAIEDGKGLSIWDTHCFKKGLKGGDGIDHYHRYKEDVGLMKWMGLDAYRFSISWSRILPNGKLSGGLNMKGVQFYKNLLRELEEKKIKPYVTLFHWDLPQDLEDEIGGFKDPKIVGHFQNYANICFMLFGDQIKHWITFNEPYTFCENGYTIGNHAPGRPRSEDSKSERYIVAHHQLLAHAAVVDLYNKNFKKEQKGKIGITLNAMWGEPYNTQSNEDKAAADRALDFILNWFLHPITKGKYPDVIEEKLTEVGVSTFKQEDTKNIEENPVDFLGINYYTAFYVKDDQKSDKDHKAEMVWGEPLGELHKDAVQWIRVYPQGLKKLLLHIKTTYSGPIYITENGYGEEMNDKKLLPHQHINDTTRVSYYHQHLLQLMELTNENSNEKVDVKGYFAWSLFDNFEWDKGFDVRFGSIYVDYKDNMKRTPKLSAIWLKHVLEKPQNNIRSDGGSHSNRALTGINLQENEEAALVLESTTDKGRNGTMLPGTAN